MNGYLPVYPQFGANIYASDVVKQALKCIADEIKKLRPMHIRQNGDDPEPVQPSDVQDCLNNPNPLMTTSDFLEKITWLLLMNYNAFVIPVYETWTDKKTGEERRYLKELYPIQPIEVDFIEDMSDKLFVRFRFMNGYITTVPYDDVIHLRYNYSVNQYMGGDLFGQPDQKSLLKILELNEQLLQGVAKSLNASYACNGVLKYNSYLDDNKINENLRIFEEKLQSSESGILPIDLKADFIPLKRETQIVDDKTLKFIDEMILRHFKVSLPILNGDYTKDQYAAWFQSCLEPLIVSMSQAFTKAIFTKGERSHHNEIKFYPKDLIFMTVDQTIEMIKELAPTGALFENEKRAALGLRPLPELVGKRYMSLNWIEADKAAQYQTGGSMNVDVVDVEREDM